VERWSRSRRSSAEQPRSTLTLTWQRLVTFHLVCFAWIFFRSDSFGTAGDMLRALVTGWGKPSPLVTSGVLLAIAAGIGSQYLPARVPQLVMTTFSRLPVLGQAAVLAVALMLTHTMGPQGVAPFIYFRF
jgi:alginate O-acetyltransferase complex protein AlgI